MKRFTLLLGMALFSFSAAVGQVYCTYSGGRCADGLRPPTAYASRVVASVCEILRTPYIDTYAGNVGNACASRHYGEPIITYSSDFLNYLASRNEWASISVLAHEVGHHVNQDISWYGSFKHPWTRELQADFVSGYVLCRMGASMADATSAFRITFSWMGTALHPDTPRRIDALRQGYYRACR